MAHRWDETPEAWREALLGAPEIASLNLAFPESRGDAGGKFVATKLGANAEWSPATIALSRLHRGGANGAADR